MLKIEVGVINPQSVLESERMIMCAARITQHSHKIHNLNEFWALYNEPYTTKNIRNLTKLPHNTLQQFGLINVIVVGASRRFLAQITRHQKEVKFMSGSLQYSNRDDDDDDDDDIVVPYELIGTDLEKEYVKKCCDSMAMYSKINDVVNNDIAGYVSPQSLRNVLLISATPFQWKYMIGLRTCHRNSTETRYVMLKIWEKLYQLSPTLFSIDTTGPNCVRGNCLERKMCCGQSMCRYESPTEILREEFSKLEVNKC